MATAIQKITLSSAQDTPFNKLVLIETNVRRVKAAGVRSTSWAEPITRAVSSSPPRPAGARCRRL